VENNLKAVVLAAGKGTRLKSDDSDAPKVMRKACGKPLLRYVLDAIPYVGKEDIIIVVGYKKDMVTAEFNDYIFAEQVEQLGTGHAVMAAKSELAGFDGNVLISYGDMPLVKRETYEAFLNSHIEQGNDCTILTGEVADDTQFGRIVRDADGSFLCITEVKDCTPEQLKITELNSGVYVFKAQMMLEALGKLKNNNSQNEYYLTDVPAIMLSDGAKIGLYKRDLGYEMIGVNTLQQLAQVEQIISAAGNST